MKKFLKIILLLTSFSLTSCSDNLDKQMEQKFVDQYPNADIAGYRFIHDNDEQKKLIDSPEFRSTYMMKKSESNTSGYDSNFVYPSVNWDEFKAGYATDFYGVLTDIPRLMDYKQHDAIKSLSEMVGDNELANEYSIDIYNDIEEYLPDFSQEQFGYSTDSYFDLKSELSQYELSQYFDIDDEVMRELLLNNWDYNVDISLYGSNEHAKELIENKDPDVDPFSVLSYQTDENKDLIYTKLFTEYHDYLKANVRHDDLVEILNDAYIYQAEEILEYVPEDILVNSYYEHAVPKEFDFNNYNDIDVLEYYFTEWAIPNSTMDAAHYTYDLNSDGLSELIILTSNEKQSDTGIYENTISIFEIQSDDVVLAAYFDYSDVYPSKRININEYGTSGVSLTVDDNGKPIMYIPFTIDSHFSYDDMVLDIYSLGYDIISMEHDYTLTQAFYQQFQLGYLDSSDYETVWYYFINNQEATEAEYLRDKP